MMDWLYHLPVVWMAVVVVAGIGFATAVIYWTVLSLAARGRLYTHQSMLPGKSRGSACSGR